MVRCYVLVVWIVKNEIKCKCQRYWLRNGQKCRYNRKKAMSSRTTTTISVQISEHLCVAMDLVKYSSTRIASFVSFKSEIATNDSKPRSSIEFHSASPEIKAEKKEQNEVKLSLEFVVFCIIFFSFFFAIVPKATAGNTKYASKAKSKQRKRKRERGRNRKHEKKISPKQKVCKW